MKIKMRIIAVFMLITPLVFAQVKDIGHINLKNVTCNTCHMCEFPTSQNPCLWPCPRVEMIKTYKYNGDIPEKVTIDEIVKIYEPVNFSHKLHADMSEISGGCVQCHHYSIKGEIRPCEACHSPERKRDDVSRPDLKGAYHQQCMTCHRKWSGESDCESCHAFKDSKKAPLAEKKDYKAIKHPKLQTPEKVVFTTESDEGAIVTFYHAEHNKLFGFGCADCHQDEKCVECHLTDKAKSIVNGRLETNTNDIEFENHTKCEKCHDTEDNCNVCHKEKEAAPFNHKAASGWALNRFHKKLQCRNCHGKQKQFKKLSNECVSCHRNWNGETFNHGITGIELDENHIDNDCQDCHIDSKFNETPTCVDCHEDKSYPKDIPGKKVR